LFISHFLWIVKESVAKKPLAIRRQFRQISSSVPRLKSTQMLCLCFVDFIAIAAESQTPKEMILFLIMQESKKKINLHRKKKLPDNIKLQINDKNKANKLNSLNLHL
jgi:hypothetical protein